MTALLYFVVAVLAAALATRAFMSDPDEPARQAFLGLGWCVALSYASFSLSLLPGLAGLRLVYMASSCAIPVFSLWTVDRVFVRDEEWSPAVVRLGVITGLLVVAALVLHLVFYSDVPRSSPAEIAVSVFAYGAFGLTLWRLWEAHDATSLRVDKARVLYVLAVAGTAAISTLIEQLARNLAPPVDPQGLSIASRGVVLQGAVPPFSVLLVGLTLYFLYQTLIMYRLIDLHELFSRIATLVVTAFILVIVDGVTVMWVDTFTDYPFHGTFQIFLASVVFLAAYDPIQKQVSWWSNRLINQRGQVLAETVEALRGEVPAVISTAGLTSTLLSRLYDSGRVPSCSVYLWEAGLDAYTLAGRRGGEDDTLLEAVAAHPFTDALAAGEPWYIRTAVGRRARQDPKWREVLDLMDAMAADLTLPFVKGGVVLGWVQLRDEAWSDGFSADEIQRLQEVAEGAAVVLSNIQDFEKLEEEHRLAALGAMAAGLAHEIRNPLAGIKGAAQYLQDDMPTEASDMLTVVIDETDRLNTVVSQFLDYARPMELDLEEGHINAVVTHVLTLARAQGLPEGVTVHEDLAGDLPVSPMDSTQLSQVLLNLIQNGLQAMPEGGELRVTTRQVTTLRGRRLLEIAVSDAGTGISAEDREKLFTPFFTSKRDGTGLGLAICQRIVQAHGGEIEVHSEPQRGSTFLVRLPMPEVRPSLPT